MSSGLINQATSNSRSFHHPQFPSSSSSSSLSLLPQPTSTSTPIPPTTTSTSTSTTNNNHNHNQNHTPLPGPSPKPKPVSNSLINLLVIIILSSLKSELVHTALFFSERLHALIPSSEFSIWLLSLSLLRTGNHQATVHLLKNTPIFIPQHQFQNQPIHEPNPKGKAKLVDDDPFNIQNSIDEMDQSLWNWNHHEALKGKQRAAHSASTRCALVYSKACNLINRPKEGLEVYLKAIDQFGLTDPNEDAFINSLVNPLPSQSASYNLLATLAYKSHEFEKASELYRRALVAPDGHLCWEAFEGLCQTATTDADIDVDSIFGGSALDDYLPGYMELDDSTIHGALNNLKHAQHFSGDVEEPMIRLNPTAPHTHIPSQSKDSFRILGAVGLQNNPAMLTDNSFSENGNSSSFGVSSFDHLSYPRHAVGGAPQRAINNLATGKKPNGASMTNGHFIKPSVPQRLFQRMEPSDPSLVEASGMGSHDSMPISSTPNLQQGFSFDRFNPNIPPPMPAPSPLPFDGFASTLNPVIEPLPSLVSNGRGLPGIKRSRSHTKSNEHNALTDTLPAVSKLSMEPNPTQVEHSNNERDIGTDGLGPKYSSPPKNKNTRSKVGLREKKRVKSNGNLFDEEEEEKKGNPRNKEEKILAINWLKDLLKRFGKAYLNLSRFQCEEVLDELSNLSDEQKRSWRVYCLIGRARFEMLDYKSAEIAFRKAREAFPHLVTHMDIYSTLLWHLRKTTNLSYLSQELQLINPTAPETWIATGNLFSRLDDHPNALKSFKRATQLSTSNEYAYTLSGHECLITSEYSRSLIFFRESLRRKPIKNYTAYFGLGECYFKQEKYKLSKYFFEEAYKINERNPLIICGIGKVLEKLGEENEAIKVYGIALEIGNRNGKLGEVNGNGGCESIVRFSRAKVLIGMGEYEAAKTDLIELIKTVPTEYNVRFLLGKVYGILGDRKNCVKELTYAQDLEPKSAGSIKKILIGLQEEDEKRMNELDENLNQDHEERRVGHEDLSTYSV
ncbi:cell division cycle protein 27 [Melampsora americana]|nr:cell division cycle protein 27 [Melampsora americana]